MRVLNVFKAIIYPSHRRRALAKRLFWILRKVGIYEVIVRRKVGTLHISTSDMIIGLEAVANGGLDQDTFFQSVQILKDQGAINGPKFLDIGANVGHITVYAMSSGEFQSAICFEPDPDNFRRLASTVRLNEYHHVSCVNAGLSDVAGSLALYKNPDNFGDYRPAPNDKLLDNGWQSVSISVDTLDHMLLTHGATAADIGFMCIDVQGWEGHVLSGAASVLKHGVPLLIEIWPFAMTENGTYDKAIQALRTHYDAFYVKRGATMVLVGLDEVVSEAAKSSDREFQFDLLCVKAPTIVAART